MLFLAEVSNLQEIFYIDLYFSLNTFLDGLCLFLVGCILPRPLRLVRLIIASLWGGAFACLVLLFNFSPLALILLFFPACLVSCWITFGHRPIKMLFRAFLFFLFSLFLCGGAFTALQSLAGIAASEQRLGGFFLLIFLPLIGLGALLYQVVLRRRFDTHICEVDFMLDAKLYRCTALIDSGNLLQHPDHCCPVVLIGTEAVRRLLPPATLVTLLMHETHSKDTVSIQTALGTQTLCGQKVDTAYIKQGSKKRPLGDFFLAYDKQNRTYGGCDLLLPSSMIQ